MSRYLRRVVDEELDDLVAQLPAISLEGPRGVGKTATALQRAGSVRRFDEESQRLLVSADPNLLSAGAPPRLIDEWQRWPESWDHVRRAVDADSAPGQFLLTGSASPAQPPTHSGAGRIVSVRMRPLTLTERGVGSAGISLRGLLTGGRPDVRGTTRAGLSDYAREIVSSGFPGLRGLSDRAMRNQLDGYLRHIVDRDFPDQGFQLRRPVTLLAWMRAYAAATSTTASYDRIRDAATAGADDKPAKTTTIAYREVLERMWIVDPLPAWLPSRSPIRRLVLPPKHQLADPALAVRLLGLDVDALLEGRPADVAGIRDGVLLGHLFEALVTSDIRVYAQNAEAGVAHLRTKGGEREVDLIVERGDRRVVAIEVKLTRAVSDDHVRHLRWLRDEIGDDLLDSVVVTTGEEAYRRRDGIAVVPAALLGP